MNGRDSERFHLLLDTLFENEPTCHTKSVCNQSERPLFTLSTMKMGPARASVRAWLYLWRAYPRTTSRQLEQGLQKFPVRLHCIPSTLNSHHPKCKKSACHENHRTSNHESRAQFCQAYCKLYAITEYLYAIQIRSTQCKRMRVTSFTIRPGASVVARRTPAREWRNSATTSYVHASLKIPCSSVASNSLCL